MMTLFDYLRDAGARPWVWGEHDCCCFPAGWVQTWGLGDPMAEWRGRYRDERGALRFVSRAGGLEALWQRGLASIGIHPVNSLQPGDVGVIPAIGEGNVAIRVGAIFEGERWVSLAPSGIMCAPAVPDQAWGRR